MKNLTRLTPFSLSSYLLRTLTTSSSSITNFSLKNVTKSNFDETLLNLTTHVKDADFVAIDLEMTGVTSSPWREAFEFDRSDIQYLKVKDSAEKFAVLQFGVCPFRFDSLRNSFVAHPLVSLYLSFAASVYYDCDIFCDISIKKNNEK